MTALAATPLRAGFDPPVGDARAIDALAVGDASPGAYQWWYFDALSDDGRFAVVVIFFVGGVFSPLYADRLAAGIAASPMDHAMVNLAVYERGKKRAWVFSEYPREYLTVHQADLDIALGRSRITRRPDGSYQLVVDDDDLPARRAIRFTMTLTPQEPGLAPPGFALSGDGRHFWASPAPRGRVEARCDSLGLSFAGTGYHDVNLGHEPLHAGFREWSWGRAHLAGETRIYYDAMTASGRRNQMILSGRRGELRRLAPTFDQPAPGWTPWLLRPPAAPTAVESPESALSVRRETRLESSPFYERSVSVFSSGRDETRGICEYVNLTRFARPAIRFMLRYRIYRRPRPGAPPLPAQVTRRQVFPDDAS